MKITKENIWEEALNENIEILENDLVDTIKDMEGKTPLHVLAYQGRVEVLNHPSVDRITDNKGRTPLHYLSIRIGKELLFKLNKIKKKDITFHINSNISSFGYHLVFGGILFGMIIGHYLL